MGYERIYFYVHNGDYFDISVVQMYRGEKLLGDGWPNIPTKPQVNRIGARACLVGMMHDRSNCGVITQLGATVKVGDFFFDENNLSGATYCSHEGDSGGAVYNYSGALGINTLGDPRHNEVGTPGVCSSHFVPINSILTALEKYNIHIY